MKRLLSHVARGVQSRWFLVFGLLGMLGTIGWLGWATWQHRQPEAIWQRVRVALSQGNSELARIELHNIIQKTPRDATAHWELAKIYRQRAAGVAPEAYAGQPRWLVHLATAAELRPHDEALQRELMQAYVKLNRRYEAAATAERLVEIDPTIAEAHYWLAWRAVARGKTEAADHHLEALQKHASPPWFRGLALEAKLANDNNDSQRLAHIVDRAITVAMDLDTSQLADLSDEEHRALLGLLALAGDLMAYPSGGAAPSSDAEPSQKQLPKVSGVSGSQQVGRALKVLEQLASLNDPLALRNAADLAAQLAQRYVTACIQQSIDNASSATVSFFSTSEQQGETTVAPVWLTRVEALVRQAMHAGIASPEATQRLAAVWIGLGKTQDAIDLLKQVCTGEGVSTGISENDIESLAVALLPHRKLLAEQFLRQGHWEACREQARYLIENEQTAADGHFLIGQIDLSAGRFDEALRHFLEVEHHQGETLPVRAALAHTYLALGKWREALPHIVALRTAVEQSDKQAGPTSMENTVLVRALRLDAARLRRTEAYVRLALGQWDEALPLLLSLRNTPYNIDAVDMAFRFLWTQGRRGEALKQLTAARSRFPDNVRLLRHHATALALIGQTDEADRLVREFATQHPREVSAQLFAARWSIARRHYDEALNRLERLRQDAPDCDAASVLLAQLTLALGQPDRAVAVARSIPTNSPWAPAAMLIAIDALLEQGDLQAASRLCEQLTDTAWHELARGRLALEEQSPTMAIEAFAQSLKFSRLRSLAQSGLHMAIAQQERQGNGEHTRRLIERLLQEHPQNNALLLLAARFALRENDPRAALDRIQKLEIQRGATPGLLVLKSQALEALGNVEAAWSEIQRALEIDAHSVPARLHAAQLALRLKRWPEALKHSQAVLAVAPAESQAMRIQVEAQYRMGNDQAAETTLRRWIEQQPQTPIAHRLLVRLYARRGQLDQAQQTVEKALAHCPADTELHGERIRLLLRQNRWAEAAQRADQAHHTAPGFDMALTFASAFYDARDFSSAEHWSRLALEQANLSQQRMAALWLLGNVQLGLFRQTGERHWAEQARQSYEAVLAENPTHLQAGNNLAWLMLEALDDAAAALRIAEQVRAERPVSELPPAFIDTLATIYRRCGRLQEAADLLNQAAQATNGAPLVLYQLGLLYVAQEQPLRAKAALIRALRDGLDGPAADEARRQLARLKASNASG